MQTGLRRTAVTLAALALGLLLAGWVVTGRWRARHASPVIAVGWIRDYSTPDTSRLAGALPGMLATNLGRLRGLHVLSGARLYEVAGLINAADGAGQDSSATIARAARLAGAQQVLEGELYRRADSRLRLDLRRVDVRDGTVLGAYTLEGDDLFALVDRATAEIAAGAGLPAPPSGIATVTTSSLRAYQLYEAGLQTYYRLGDRLAAHRLFAAALAADSNFAMAAYYAAISVRWIDASYNEYWPRAARLAHRATDRERLLILGTWGHAWPGVDRVAAAETLAARYPTDPDGELLIGDGLLFLRRDYVGAIPHLQRVATMDSLALLSSSARCLACDALELLINAYAAADSSAARIRTARQWVRLQPRSARAWNALAYTLADVGQQPEAREAFDSLVRVRGPNPGDAVFGAVLDIRAGAFEKADRQLAALLRSGDAGVRSRVRWYLIVSFRDQGRDREAIAQARQLQRAEPQAWEYKALEAMALLERGRARAAATLFDSLARTASDPVSASIAARVRAWLLTHVATALAAARDTAALAAVADTVEALAPRVGFAQDRYFPTYPRGLVFLARGRPIEAGAMFRAAVYTLTVGCPRVNLELAKLALQAGRPLEAVAVLRPALQASPGGETSIYLNRTELHLLLGRAFDAAGQSDSAAVHYRWVLNAWKRADPEFTARRDSVRARLAALRRT